MTAEELAERIRKRKEHFCNIAVEQAINCDLVYESLEGLPINVDSLSKEQLLEMISKRSDRDEM